LVDNHSSSTAPALFTLKGGASAQHSPTASPRAKARIPAVSVTASITPSARPSTSSRWQPAVTGMQEHYLLPDGKPSSVLSYDDVAEDVIEDIQIQFNESKRAVVTVRNFHPRPVASQRTTGATTMTSSRTRLGKIDSGRAERGPIGSKAQVASSSLFSSSSAAAAAGRMSERPQVPYSQQPIS